MEMGGGGLDEKGWKETEGGMWCMKYIIMDQFLNKMVCV